MKKIKEHKEKGNSSEDNGAGRHENNDSLQSSTSLAVSEHESLHKGNATREKILKEIESLPDNEIWYHSDGSNFC